VSYRLFSFSVILSSCFFLQSLRMVHISFLHLVCISAGSMGSCSPRVCAASSCILVSSSGVVRGPSWSLWSCAVRLSLSTALQVLRSCARRVRRRSDDFVRGLAVARLFSRQCCGGGLVSQISVAWSWNVDSICIRSLASSSIWSVVRLCASCSLVRRVVVCCRSSGVEC